MCLLHFHISIEHIYLSGVWWGVDPRTNTNKTYAHKILAYVLSYVNQPRLNSQHSWESSYHYLMNVCIFALIIKNWVPQIWENWLPSQMVGRIWCSVCVPTHSPRERHRESYKYVPWMSITFISPSTNISTSSLPSPFSIHYTDYPT